MKFKATCGCGAETEFEHTQAGHSVDCPACGGKVLLEVSGAKGRPEGWRGPDTLNAIAKESLVQVQGARIEVHNGCLMTLGYFVAGLLVLGGFFSPFLWLFAVLIVLATAFLIRRYRCPECGNSVAGADVRACPTCKVVLAPPEG